MWESARDFFSAVSEYSVLSAHRAALFSDVWFLSPFLLYKSWFEKTSEGLVSQAMQLTVATQFWLICLRFNQNSEVFSI